MSSNPIDQNCSIHNKCLEFRYTVKFIFTSSKKSLVSLLMWKLAWHWHALNKKFAQLDLTFSLQIVINHLTIPCYSCHEWITPEPRLSVYALLSGNEAESRANDLFIISLLEIKEKGEGREREREIRRRSCAACLHDDPRPAFCFNRQWAEKRKRRNKERRTAARVSAIVSSSFPAERK